MKMLFVGLAAALSLVLARAAYAATCSIGAIVGVAFGSYDVFSGSALDSAGSVTYRCDDVAALDTIMVQLSRGSSITFQPRTLIRGAHQLQYNLYLDPSRSTVWGDGSSGTGQYGPTLPPNGANVLLNIYGRMPSRQNVHVGAYSDTVVVSIVF
jgi:spore coat protein U-like protein